MSRAWLVTYEWIQIWFRAESTIQTFNPESLKKSVEPKRCCPNEIIGGQANSRINSGTLVVIFLDYPVLILSEISFR